MAGVTQLFNLLQVDEGPVSGTPEGRSFVAQSMTGRVGATRTGMSIYVVEPGQQTWPYHFEQADEEWVLVLEGEIVLRTPTGEQTLRRGDVRAFPVGPAGAHAFRNDGSATARYALLSTVGADAHGTVYPDSGTFVMRTKDWSHRGRLGDAVAYWEGER